MTVEEILRQSGFTDEQIKGLDAKAMSAFSTVLTTASTAQTEAARLKEEAELAQRAQEQMYRDQIEPALSKWGIDQANIMAERDFYKTQAEQAKGGGFIPKDAPTYTPPAGAGRDPKTGEFVAGANVVPGSPAYLTADQGIKALSNAHWASAEYQRLFNAPIPDDFDVLLKEASDRRLDFKVHVNQKYGFDKKRSDIVAARQKEHDDKLIKDTEDRMNRQWAERMGNNPNVRPAAASEYSTLSKGVKDGQRKDPTQMTEAERRQNTRANIQHDIAQRESGMVN